MSRSQLGGSRRAPADSGALSVDLVVVGGGSGGIGAAVAAARRGLSVAIVEKSETIGGNANRCGVNAWEPVAGATGLPLEIYDRLRRIPYAVGVYGFGRHVLWDGPDAFPGGEHVIVAGKSYRDTLLRHGFAGLKADEVYAKNTLFGVVFEPAAYEAVLFQMLGETGLCSILTGTTVTRVEGDGSTVRRLTLSDGRTLAGRYYVDGTGDGELCRGAGCTLVSGQESRATYDEPSAPDESTNTINACSLIFRITPKPVPSIDPLPEGVDAGCWWGERFPVVSCVSYPNGDRNINMLPTMEGLEYLELGHEAAYRESRRRVYATWHYIQERYPEFRGYRIRSLAPSIGVRETYRVITDYVLTEHDVAAGLSQQNHGDIIAIADHALDRHGRGGGARELAEPFGIPYRCLLPKGYSNLAVACRAAGFSSVAASSCRLSRTMMHLGQAAGTAAALARAAEVSLPEVPSESLRAELMNDRVQLEWPAPAHW